MLRSNRGSEKGDTIVEVLIVLAILGLAISLSYTTANHSLLSARQAQESSEAATLLQSQVEELKVLAPLSTSTVAPNNVYNIFLINTPAQFCIDTSTSPAKVKSIPASPAPFPAECTAGPGGIYKLTITYDGSVGAADTFKLQATWDDVLGEGSDTVTLFVRVHKP